MINEELTLSIYKIIRAYGIRPTMFNESGDIIYYPEQSNRFYLKRQNVMVTIEDELVTVTKGSLSDYDQIKPLVDQIKKIVHDYNYSFDLKSLGRVIKAKEFSPKSEPIYAIESTAFPKAKGGSKTSYIKLTLQVWIIIKHSRNMKDKDNCRTMPFAIEDMYVKNGYERTQCPCHLKTAKAYARHLEQGGDTKDSLSLLLTKVGYVVVQLKELIKLFRKEKMLDELRMAKKYKKGIEKDLHGLSRKTKYERLKDEFMTKYGNIDQLDESGTKHIKVNHEVEEYHTCGQALTALDKFAGQSISQTDKAIKKLKSLNIKDCQCYSDMNALEFSDTREKMLYLIDGILDEVGDISDDVKGVMSEIRLDVDKGRPLTSYHKKFMEQLI